MPRVAFVRGRVGLWDHVIAIRARLLNMAAPESLILLNIDGVQGRSKALHGEIGAFAGCRLSPLRSHRI
jgi:hypothetical protein